MDKPESEGGRERLVSRRSTLSPARQALLERRLGGKLKGRGGTPPASPIRPVPRGGELPLTLREERIIEGCLKRAEGRPKLALAADGAILRAVMPKLCRLRGRLDRAAMEQAVCDLARRHETLRMKFSIEGGRATRLIEPSLTPALTVIDLEHLPEGRRLEAALEIASAEAQRPFELDGELLWRTLLLRLGPADHLLLLVVDHFVSDDWSMNLLVRDTWELYQARVTGSAPALPELPIQFADYAHWERRGLRGAALDRLLSYWRRQLDGMSPVPEVRLPIELPSARLSGRLPAGTVSAALPRERGDSLRAWARERNATLQVTALSSLFALLHLYTGRNEFGVCVLSAKRHRPETQDVVGCFTDFEVLRAGVFGGDTFSELLMRVRDVAIEAQEHGDLPHIMFPGQRPDVAEELLHPSIAFNMIPRDVRPRRPRRGGEAAAPPALGVAPMASHQAGCQSRPPGLRLIMAESKDALNLVLNYTLEGYDAGGVRDFLRDYCAVLERVTANPRTRLCDLPVSFKGSPAA